jgi:hypothetical protein
MGSPTKAGLLDFPQYCEQSQCLSANAAPTSTYSVYVSLVAVMIMYPMHVQGSVCGTDQPALSEDPIRENHLIKDSNDIDFRSVK